MYYNYIKQKYGNYALDESSFKYDNVLLLNNTSFESKCPFCKTTTSKIHQSIERNIIDFAEGDFFNVKFKSRKFYCAKCKKVFTEEIPFTIGKCKYSTRFIKFILDDYKYTSNNWGVQIFVLFRSYTYGYKMSKSTYYSLIDRYDYKSLKNKKTNYYLEIEELNNKSTKNDIDMDFMDMDFITFE